MNSGKSLEGIGHGLVEFGVPFRHMPGGTEYNCETIKLVTDRRQSEERRMQSLTLLITYSLTYLPTYSLTHSLLTHLLTFLL